jgi:hypothetical protein
MRHKEINIMNFPAGLKYVYDFVQSNIKSEKLKNRILVSDRGLFCNGRLATFTIFFKIHKSWTELQNKVNKKCLPLEFGGIMPMRDMIELWKKELASKRELLLSYDIMNLLSDRGIICRRNAPAQDDTGVGSLPGSFRKLEVD